jgi:hypothetical protein
MGADENTDACGQLVIDLNFCTEGYCVNRHEAQMRTNNEATNQSWDLEPPEQRFAVDVCLGVCARVELANKNYDGHWLLIISTSPIKNYSASGQRLHFELRSKTLGACAFDDLRLKVESF